MKILIPLMHPAHVHLFRNVINILKSKDHKIKVVAIEKDITIELLDLYNIDYEIINSIDNNGLQKRFFTYIKVLSKLKRISKEFKSDIYLSRTVLPFSRVFLRIPHVCFFDSDLETLTSKILSSDFLFTPHRYEKPIKSKLHVKLPTYKELAYLHPSNFTPNKSSLEKLDITPNSRYTLLRFSGYEAWHDVGQCGINQDMKVNLVNTLAEHSDVYISSENELPEDLKKYELDISYDKIHDVLYYADLFAGDSQTMTTEAAVLGTPAIRCNSFVGKDDMSNFIELEKKYKLIYNYRDPKKAIRKATELIKKPKLKEKWAVKRERLLKDKIDLTSFFVWLIDNYPESVDLLKQDEEYYQKVVE